MHPFQSENLVPRMLDERLREAELRRRHGPAPWRQVAGARFVHAGEWLSRFGRRMQAAGGCETTTGCAASGL